MSDRGETLSQSETAPQPPGADSPPPATDLATVDDRTVQGEAWNRLLADGLKYAQGPAINLQRDAALLRDLQVVLDRHRGELAVAESELPAPKAELVRAALGQAAANKSTTELAKSVLMELPAFIPDDSAILVQDYDGVTHSGGTSTISPEDRRKAEQVLALIRWQQALSVTMMRGDDQMGAANALRGEPVRVGAARESMDAVDTYKTQQSLGGLSAVSYLITAGVVYGASRKGWISINGWEGAVFVVGFFLSGFFGLPPARLHRIIRSRTSSDFYRNFGDTLLIGTTALMPALFMGMVYIVFRAFGWH